MLASVLGVAFGDLFEEAADIGSAAQDSSNGVGGSAAASSTLAASARGRCLARIRLPTTLCGRPELGDRSLDVDV
jgi:hypothetical protein